jgi:hypothetical protein
MEYDVHCVFGGWLDEDDEDPTTRDVMKSLTAVYENAALRSGRIIASHTMRLNQREYLFLVEEIPNQQEVSGDA